MDLRRRWKLLPRTNAGDTVFGGSDVADLRTLRTHTPLEAVSRRGAPIVGVGAAFSVYKL